MIRPGPRLQPALIATVVVAVAAIQWPLLGYLALGLGLGILVLAAIEAVRLGRITLHVERPAHLAVGLGSQLAVPARLSHDGAVALSLIARQPLTDQLGGGAVTRAGVCPPGAHLALALPCLGSERGEGALAPLAVAWTRFGLIERIAAVGAASVVSVLPDLSQVRRLRRQFDALFLRGMGTRLAPRSGQGREFDRLREYVQGDDWRQIEWKASARRGQLILRDFRVERSQDVVLCIDHGHRMAARVAGARGVLTRTDHAVNAAVLSAWISDRCEDRVGLLSFAAEVEQGIGQGRGAAHLAALTAVATGIMPVWLHTDYRALAAHLVRRLKTRSLVLITTVLPERGEHGDLLQAMRMIRGRHLPVVLVLTDPVLDASARSLPSDRRELCRTLVAGDLVDGRRQLIAELRRLGALVAETAPDAIGSAAVNAYLDVKRRQLL
jgi:uncharacterized protein (DUF58 family)